MPAKWHDAKIVRIERLGPKTSSFWLETSEPLQDFRPGQFITLDLPIHERRNKRWRSYSIANHPRKQDQVELCVVRLEGGLASDFLFERAEVGTEVTFKGPAGVFTLPAELPSTLVLICTGTGVAPFRSMLMSLRQKGAFQQKVHLIFGTRHREGILYREEFEELAQFEPNFRYDVALSREPDWSGYQGYVHQIYETIYHDVSPNTSFMICGWSMVVDDTAARLLDMGYQKSQVRFELYG